MTTTNHSDGAGNPAAELSQLLKTDALGRTRMSHAQREAILDSFEASGMTASGFKAASARKSGLPSLSQLNILAS